MTDKSVRANPGLFITLEGGEGAGKTTQINRLQAHLEQSGRHVVLTREPGGTNEAELLRKTILDRANNWDATEQLLLFNAARHHHWRQLIQPSLDRGEIVICDRYLDSTITYQGAAGGVSPARVLAMHELVFSGAAYPDLTLYIDVPVDVAAARRQERDAGQEIDRFEAEKRPFHQKLRDGFQDLCRKYPDRVKQIDGSGDVAQVARQISDFVDGYLNHG